MVELPRLQMTIWRRVACWSSKATHAQAHAAPAHPRPHTRAHASTQKYIVPIAGNSGFVNTPECYVVCLVIIHFINIVNRNRRLRRCNRSTKRIAKP